MQNPLWDDKKRAKHFLKHEESNFPKFIVINVEHAIKLLELWNKKFCICNGTSLDYCGLAYLWGYSASGLNPQIKGLYRHG